MSKMPKTFKRKKQKLKRIQFDQLTNLNLIYMSNGEIKDEAIDAYIGSRLKFARVCKSLTLQDVAKLMNITYQQVGKFESGENSLKVRQLLKLSDKLNLSMKWIVGGLLNYMNGKSVNSSLPYDLQKLKGGENDNQANG